jgi:hypothetical protein
MTRVTSTGFKLWADTQRESRFFGVTVNWIAYAERPVQTQSDVVVAYPKYPTGELVTGRKSMFT